MVRRIMLIMPPNDSDLDGWRKPWWSLCRIPPIGLLSIGSYLKNKDYETKIVDCRELIAIYPNEHYLKGLVVLLKEFAPDVIGINMLTANFNHVADIAFGIKVVNPSIKVVLGGVHPSVEPELTFKQIPETDAICAGAGEDVMLEVAEGKDLDRIEGLMVRDKPFIPRKPEMDIDKYPYPDYSLVNQDWYTQFSTYTITGFGFKGISALTSRSCPYSCFFCSADWSKPFRYHSADYVVGLAKHLAKMDIDVISFFDDTIALREDRLVEICEGFIKEKIFYPHTNLRWIGELRADQAETGLLRLMKKAGCFHIGMGVESGSDRMLKVINKKVMVEENKQACGYIKDEGLHLGISFMMGIPAETEEDMKATVSFMREINCNYMGIGSFRPLPGSKFFDELIKDKETVDWVNLGNFMLPPKYKFYDASERVFNRLFDEAYNYAYGRQWVAVHEGSYFPAEMGKSLNVKMCAGNNYYSDCHKQLSKRGFKKVAEIVYMKLPYELRKLARNAVRWLAKRKLLSGLLWRYV